MKFVYRKRRTCPSRSILVYRINYGKAQAVMAPKAFTEEELERFIEGMPKKDEKGKGKSKTRQ